MFSDSFIIVVDFLHIVPVHIHVDHFLDVVIAHQVINLSASKFVEVEEATADGPLVFADEHVIGVAKGCDDEMIKDLNNHFMGECTEVGMYLAMSRLADRERCHG